MAEELFSTEDIIHPSSPLFTYHSFQLPFLLPSSSSSSSSSASASPVSLAPPFPPMFCFLLFHVICSTLPSSPRTFSSLSYIHRSFLPYPCPCPSSCPAVTPTAVAAAVVAVFAVVVTVVYVVGILVSIVVSVVVDVVVSDAAHGIVLCVTAGRVVVAAGVGVVAATDGVVAVVGYQIAVDTARC